MAANQIKLVGMSDAIQGLQWQSDQLLRIGRQPSLEVVVNEPTLSRQHAEIRATPQGWVVQDLGSSSGTLLNAVPVGKLTRKLKAEDVVQCGKLTFKVLELQWRSPETARSSFPQDIKTSGLLMRVQALSQLTWEQGLRNLSLEDVPVPHAKQFLTLLRAGYHLSRIENANELLQTLLDDTVAVLNAQHGAILLQNGTTGELALKTVSGAVGGSRAYSKTLAKRCFSKGESFLCQGNDGLASCSGEIGDGMASIICVSLRSARRRLGVLHLDRGPLQPPFSQDDFKLADGIAATVSVGIESAVAVERQREQFVQEVIDLAQQVMAVHDAATAEHCQRVGAIALALAGEMRLTEAETQQLKLGALLHDLGKVSVPPGLTGKSGILRGDDEKQLRAHPLHGAAIAEKISAFAEVVPIIRCHHECWDGSGYPAGLSGDAIPRLARIVAVADAVDNLLTGQLEQPARSLDEVLVFMRAESARKFDPAVVAALVQLREKNLLVPAKCSMSE